MYFESLSFLYLKEGDSENSYANKKSSLKSNITSFIKVLGRFLNAYQGFSNKDLTFFLSKKQTI